MIEDLVQVLIQKDILDQEHRKEYEYVLTTKIEKIVTYSILLLVALEIEKPVQGMIFAISFVRRQKTTVGLSENSG